MNRIDRKFAHAQKRPLLMTHVVAGYPNLQTTRELVSVMHDAGADMIELQIPFSDPLGDGMTIRQANSAAIENGFRVREIFDVIRTLRAEGAGELPLLIMTYLNIVHHFGYDSFCRHMREAGADGLIIPDYPLEAEPYERLMRTANDNDVYLIPFISPKDSDDRMHAVGELRQGFVYCFARVGITGAHERVAEGLGDYMKRVRRQVSMPLALGFGISAPEHMRALPKEADMAIVGSAVLDAYNRGGLPAVRESVARLSTCTH